MAPGERIAEQRVVGAAELGQRGRCRQGTAIAARDGELDEETARRPRLDSEEDVLARRHPVATQDRQELQGEVIEEQGVVDVAKALVGPTIVVCERRLENDE